MDRRTTTDTTAGINGEDTSGGVKGLRVCGGGKKGKTKTCFANDLQPKNKCNKDVERLHSEGHHTNDQTVADPLFFFLVQAGKRGYELSRMKEKTS